MSTKNKSKQIFLLSTNKNAEEVFSRYRKIESSVRSLGDSLILFHGKKENKPPLNSRVYEFSDNSLENSPYQPITDKLLPGSNHFPLLEFYNEHPTFDYYWYIADSVIYNGNWSVFFSGFNQNNDDFISSHLRNYDEEEAWYWWDTLNHSYQHIPKSLRLRSFNPIFRISNKALFFLHQALTGGWRGHHEVLIPTLLYLEGFRISDFGGIGNFVKDKHINKHYIGCLSDIHGNLNKGSMRYQPVVIESDLQINKLYHPVKIPGF